MPTPKYPIYISLVGLSYATLHGHSDHHLPGNASPMSLPLTMTDGTAEWAGSTTNVATTQIQISKYPTGIVSPLLTSERPIENTWQAYHGFGVEG